MRMFYKKRPVTAVAKLGLTRDKLIKDRIFLEAS